MTTPRWSTRTGWTGWRRELGWLLMVLGAVLLGGAVSQLIGHAMPVPAATPQMRAQHAEDLRQAGLIALLGVPTGLAVLTAGIWFIAQGRRRAQAATFS